MLNHFEQPLSKIKKQLNHIWKSLIDHVINCNWLAAPYGVSPYSFASHNFSCFADLLFYVFIYNVNSIINYFPVLVKGFIKKYKIRLKIRRYAQIFLAVLYILYFKKCKNQTFSRAKFIYYKII